MRLSNVRAAVGVAAVLAAVAALLLAYPQHSLTAALRGISIWWDVLFPALLPFFIISEVLLGFGIVHFFGTMLDPLMRPLFRIPGIGGFAMALGFASGYPVGARLTSQLWEQKLISRVEGERLVAFITTSDPIFLIGAVSVGFFRDAGLAVILGVAHYGSALLIGLGMRFYGREEERAEQAALRPAEAAPQSWSAVYAHRSPRPVLMRAFQAMHGARVKDGRPIGVLLSGAVKSAIQMNFVVGGLVVFFSVVLEVLTSAGVMSALHAGIGSLLQLFGLPQALSQAVVSGLFEVTLGAKASAADAALPLAGKAAVAAFVLSWAGLSVHAQIVSLLSGTPLRYAPFAVARLAHGLLAALAVTVLWGPLQPLRAAAGQTAAAFMSSSPAHDAWTYALPGGLALLALALALLALAAAAVRLLQRLLQRGFAE
ncbi:membrane protein [Gordoniibacillus kamchatkensis]|uniref:Membrane protein n=1 Tax=Gordoniibacillus kamchatkensis TaxID=1590651 RepID=A0ABR5AN31_9BACL|nr:sporulation integral membrane protein YlbJ [Paenibacillus sp. VKM B-2647]KIL42433.1 membrane protein [Paenibacillus sp. VKM B-2647]